MIKLHYNLRVTNPGGVQ